MPPAYPRLSESIACPVKLLEAQEFSFWVLRLCIDYMTGNRQILVVVR